MSYDVSVPFLHPVACATLMGATLVVERLLPQRWMAVLRWVLALAVAALIVGLGVAIGWFPWLGQIRLAAYTAFLLGGFLVAWWMLRSRMDALGARADDLRSLVLTALIAGIIGARARYVIERWDDLVREHGRDVWWVALDLDRGGAVWYGGAFLAAVAVLIGLYRRRIPLLPAADLILPATLVGLGIGRIGCYFNGCCFGGPTELPWGIACPRPPHHLVHPTSLYECGAAISLGLALWYGWHWRTRDGQVTAMALVGYGIWRFINEGLRGDHDVYVVWPWFGTLTTSQATSVMIVIGGLMLWAGIAWRRRPLSAMQTRRDGSGSGSQGP